MKKKIHDVHLKKREKKCLIDINNSSLIDLRRLWLSDAWLFCQTVSELSIEGRKFKKKNSQKEKKDKNEKMREENKFRTMKEQKKKNAKKKS